MMYKQSMAIFLALFIGVSFSAAAMADTRSMGMTRLASANPCSMGHNPCAKKNPCGKMNPCGMKEGHSCKEMMNNPCAHKGNPCGMKKCEEMMNNPCGMKGNPCGMKHHNPCGMKGKNPCGKKW